MKEFNIDNYSLQKTWIDEVAPKYFDVNEHNMLRVGLLGYINEINSNIAEDGFNLANCYYNEVIPSRAILPETILANASLVKYDDFNAKPSTMFFTLAIKKEHILEKSVDKVTHREFYISKNSFIHVDEKYKFILDYPITIIIKSKYDDKGNLGWIFTPKYEMDKINPISDIKYPYINSFVTSVSNDEFLMLNLKGTQLSITNQIFTVYSDNIIDNMTFRIDYEGQLSHFNVYYDKPGESLIPLQTYFMDNLNPEHENFCFYRYIGDNSFEVFFSPYEHYFRPEIGSRLIIEVFTTEGKAGNFIYNGLNSYFSFEQDTLEDKYHIDYTGITTFVKNNTRSTGGVDRKSIKEIKRRVVEEFSLRNCIVTESDLNVFFNNFRRESSIIFIKKRDDVIRRLFSAYILFRNKQNEIIPTNTVTISVDQTEIDTYSNSQEIYMLKAGRQLVLKEGTFNEYICSEDTIHISEVKNRESENNFVVTSPFLIKFGFSPLKTSYYYNSINENISNKYTYISSTSYHEYSVNSINIERNAMKSDDYNINFELATNDNITNFFNNSSGVNKDTGYIKFKGIIKHNDKMIGYVDFKPSGVFREKNKVIYSATLTTSDFIDIEEMLEFENSIKVIEGGKGVVTPSTFLPYDGVRMEVCCFRKRDNLSNKSSVTRLSSLDELKDYELVNIYETEQDIKFFRNLDSKLSSKLSITNSTRLSPGYSFQAKEVPVFKYDYIKDIEPSTIYQIICDYITILEENMDKLENNFDVDIKFFNTYGRSRYYKIGDGAVSEDLYKTNISIKLRIKTHMPIDLNTKNDIKELVRTFIEGEDKQEVNEIYISNLINILQSTYKEISYVHFVGIDDYSNEKQVIENKSVHEYKTINEIREYVPEFINVYKKRVDTVNLSGEKTIEYEPDIQIEFI